MVAVPSNTTCHCRERRESRGSAAARSLDTRFPGRVRTQAWFSVGYDEERTLALCVALGAQKACPGSRRAGFQGLDQAVRAEDLDGSLDVVAEDPQRPLASG